MIILIFLPVILHWYFSLFFQSVFHHRYAAHGHFTMSPFWEKMFYIGCFLSQGSSYISARAYGILHRLHHAHTDTGDDPHSPSNSSNVFAMMWKTRQEYQDVFQEKANVEEKFKKGLPDWRAFDKIAHHWSARLMWICFYIGFYFLIATEWWMFLLLPIHFAMGAIQGASVNWWAHKIGYRNFSVNNTSTNLIPVDLVFWGESYHNNHHKNPSRPDNAVRWFEFDSGYFIMKLLHRLKIIRIKRYALQSAA